MLRGKMLAFEELRKRLEEQHAQQLSLLIAEQEREQERLHSVSERAWASESPGRGWVPLRWAREKPRAPPVGLQGPIALDTRGRFLFLRLS